MANPWKHTGPLVKAVEARLRSMAKEEWQERLWKKDPTLWKKEPSLAGKIKDRLGWLTLPVEMRAGLGEIKEFAGEAKAAGFARVLLLGMGGSSLAPEVLRKTFGVSKGCLDLEVLDSTHPDQIRSAEERGEGPKTLYLVSSKSGTTIEPNTLYQYFAARAKNPKSFAAITDPGSELEGLAKKTGFRAVFSSPPDVGGRYSALTQFGLVPAALLGADLDRMLSNAAAMAAACGPDVRMTDNPGIGLGAVLGEAALAGRNKLTLVLPRELSAFGSWIEQLIAESTGKEGRGILPVDGEPLGPPDRYGSDRLFVQVRLGAAKSAPLDSKVEALEKAGHPVVRIDLADPHDLAGEFFRWETATAAAGSIIGINAFDEPNVKESKDLTGELLAEYQKRGALPEEKPLASEGDLSLYGDDALASSGNGGGRGLREHLSAHLARLGAGDYAAWLAYLPRTQEAEKELEAMRLPVRDRRRVATTVGFGPRFLHSTGQLHKGGPNQGVFIQIIARPEGGELAIPGEKFGFATLNRAQALGDFTALKRHGRRVASIHLGGKAVDGLRTLRGMLDAAETAAPKR